MATLTALVSGLSAVLGFASFGLSFEPPTQNYHIEVRTGNEHYDSSGSLPHVNLYDNNYHNFASSTKQDIWVEGGKRGWNDFGGSNTAQISKVEVNAGNNDICLAWLLVHDKGGDDKALFVGEVMQKCGASWYPSGTWMDIDGGRQVNCAWLNNGHDTCQRTGGNGDWHGFWIDQFWFWASGDASSRNPDDACWQMGKYETEQCKAKRDGGNVEVPAIYKTLSKTSRPLAQLVCDDPRSYGPSLLSTSEGLLCDMRTRTLRPLCSNGQVDGCYNDADPVVDVSSRIASTDDDLFSESDFDLDNDRQANGTLIRRASANTQGTVVNYQSSHSCKDCCAPIGREGDRINGTHWWGYGVDAPTIYRDVPSGIYISRENGTSIYVANCGTSIDANEYIYQSAAEKVLMSGLAVISAALLVSSISS